jgi:hypothetical protein
MIVIRKTVFTRRGVDRILNTHLNSLGAWILDHDEASEELMARSKIEAKGEVYGLERLRDFPGSYIQGRYEHLPVTGRIAESRNRPSADHQMDAFGLTGIVVVEQ